jgi:O-acetyl-ADP-ribose deacetylase (regulator of RNase III)
MNLELADFLDGKVKVVVGNIVKEEVDAIVNAANSTLLGGGGVDGAIHQAGGGEILAECEKLRETEYPQGLPTGEVAITKAGKLPARFVIHTVGPIKGIDTENEATQLSDCYRKSLELASSKDCRSIAFPAISTGVYYYPKDLAAAISSAAIKEFLKNNNIIEAVRLVFFRENEANIFLQNHKF